MGSRALAAAAVLSVFVQAPHASAQATAPYPGAQPQSATPAYGVAPSGQPTAQQPYGAVPATAPAAPYSYQQPAAAPPAAPQTGYPYQQVPAAAPTTYPQPRPQVRRKRAPAPVPWPPGYYGAPPVLPYRDGQPVPPGYRLEGTGGGGLIAAGLLIGGAVYAGGLIAAANSGFSNGTGWLALPIAGPWIAIGSRKIIGCDTVTEEQAVEGFEPISECKDAARDYASGVGFLTGAGIFQAVGLTLVALGISNRDYQLVRYDVAGFELTPKQLGAQGAGLDVTKVF